MRIGDKVTVCYKAFGPVKKYNAEIVKITPSGLLRIKTEKEKYNELFYPEVNGFAKGWNTLWWNYDQVPGEESND